MSASRRFFLPPMCKRILVTAAMSWFCATMVGQEAAPSQGRNVALVIGNDVYKYVPPLKTAVSDARAVWAVLRDRYGFEATLLTNASRAQILAALSSYRRTLGSGSSLLIYYAGHGYSDRAVDKTYWWPVDARSEDVSEWISADDITTDIKAIPAKHILVISDSCFSGGLSRGVVAPERTPLGAGREQALSKLRDRTSRQLFASGGNEPVADDGGGDHSVFAGALLAALHSMEPGEFSVEDIFLDVRASLQHAGQLPQLDALIRSGHEGGSFVFSRPLTAAEKVTRVAHKPSVQRGMDLDEEIYEAVKESRDPVQLDAIAAKIQRRTDLAEILRQRAAALRSAASPVTTGQAQLSASRTALPLSSPGGRSNASIGANESRRQAPERSWGLTVQSAGKERRIRVSISGLSSGSRLEATVLLHLQNNLGAKQSVTSEFRPTDILRIAAAFDPAPGTTCQVAEVATLTYQLETLPEPDAPGALLAPHVIKGTVCYGNDQEETSISALGKALTNLSLDSISSLTKELGSNSVVPAVLVCGLLAPFAAGASFDVDSGGALARARTVKLNGGLEARGPHLGTQQRSQTPHATREDTQSAGKSPANCCS